MQWLSIVLALLSLVYPPAPGDPGLTPRPTGPTQPVFTTPALPPIVVMSIGDSLTVGHGPNGTITESYRPELSRLMNLTGQPHQWVVDASGGKKCSYWLDRLDVLITTHHPALIFLNCGTNDTPADATEQDYRMLLGIAQARGVPVVASLIMAPDMHSDTNNVRPYIYDWMHGTYLALKRALAYYPDVPYADMHWVPANPEWLQSDGIHLTARSEAAWAQLFYLAALLIRPDWKTFAQMGVRDMCGLSGVWNDEPWRIPDIDYHVCRY